MIRMAKFEKVSEKQWMEDTKNVTQMSVKQKNEALEELVLPLRATKGSAGYDFFTPYEIQVNPGETVLVPTGVRCKMDDGWVLKIYPRSGLGFKYRIRLNNTVGIIDSDYYEAANEGHIKIKFTNEGTEKVIIHKGDGFAQGIFVEYGITIDDDADGVRVGGMGSTTKVQA